MQGKTTVAQASRGPAGPAERLGQLEAYEAALKDIVALANGDGEPRQRLVQMQRRAIAALSGADRPRSELRDYPPLHPAATRVTAEREPAGAWGRNGGASNAPEPEGHES